MVEEAGRPCLHGGAPLCAPLQPPRWPAAATHSGATVAGRRGRLPSTKRTVTASVGGGVASVAGSITTITGLILAPFTMGTSLIVTAVGIGVATAGGVVSASANITGHHALQDGSQEGREDDPGVPGGHGGHQRLPAVLTGERRAGGGHKGVGMSRVETSGVSQLAYFHTCTCSFECISAFTLTSMAIIISRKCTTAVFDLRHDPVVSSSRTTQVHKLSQLRGCIIRRTWSMKMCCEPSAVK